MKLALEELARKAVRVDGITDDEVDIEFYHAEVYRFWGAYAFCYPLMSPFIDIL